MAETVLKLTNKEAVVKITDTQTISLKTDLKGSNERVNQVSTFGSLVGGTGYSDAEGVPTTGGTGTGLTVDIVTDGGVITAVTLNNRGNGYAVSDVITITTGGADATITVTALTAESSPQVVRISKLYWTGPASGTIVVTRNSVNIATIKAEFSGELDFQGFVDSIQDDKDIVVTISGDCQLWIVLHKVSGYAQTFEPEIYGSHDSISLVGA